MNNQTTNSELAVRAAGFEDATGIFELIKSYPGELLPRSLSDIAVNIDRFIVCPDADGRIVGTVSWQTLPEIGKPTSPSVEIKSLAVARQLHGKGVGRLLVEAAIARIRALHPAQIIVLTFAPGFFGKLGFVTVPKERIMHKLYSGCINCSKYDSPFTCPEIAMALDVTGRSAGTVA